MNRKLVTAIALLACAGAATSGFWWYRAFRAQEARTQALEEPRAILVNPDDVRGVYMTANTASGKGLGARLKRDKIVKLLNETKVNGVVIDVKESNGSLVTEGLKKFVQELGAEPVWKIARVVVFTDNSQVTTHPEWYLSAASSTVWRDNRGNAWLDPANANAQNYLIAFPKSIIDLGFDEIQFDYIRYPSDGNTKAIRATGSKRKAIGAVFQRFSDELRAYKSDIKLSVDLFGYVTQRPELSIGQALEDAVPYMDYISPMVYPSHYYSGFGVKKDQKRELPAVSLSREGANADPGTVVHRSLLTAADTIASVTTTLRRAKLRPWLQDFSFGFPYGKKEITAQITAAQEADTAGWLLWNAGNTYTASALTKE
ncbi:MAG: hypothetical protein HY437_02235 [Candidatus Magasanikbacteria bacterium]|nr:hypothetical protein [Candidatus Magasanikbacteria bacterium]